MRAIYFCFLLFSLLAASHGWGQQVRCATDRVQQNVFRANPQAKVRYQQVQRMVNEKMSQVLSAQSGQRTQATITIPVVVHILLPNPNRVTDAIVQNQLDTLNKYFGAAGANDSLNVYAPFQNRFGRSAIRFCLAKRTPQSTRTTGINRIATNATFTVSTDHPNTVAKAWDTRQYLNIWVVDFSDQTLGYAYLPGTFAPGDPQYGFLVDYTCFGAGPSVANGGYHDAKYNGGRTAVHEIGHYFNLQHPWGSNDGNANCTATDFCDDTPPTTAPTFGCPNGPVTNTCSDTAPGVMWQNHMDYADDRCMLLFTKDQCARMEAALASAPDRSTLINSPGCQPVIPVPNDAALAAIVSPLPFQLQCSPQAAPILTLRNEGTSPLRNATIRVSINGAAAAPFSWTGNLATGTQTNVTLPAYNLSAGNNRFFFTVADPNGVAEINTGDDTISVSTTYLPTTVLPLVETFDKPVFSSTQWTIVNPDGDATWQLTTPGKNSPGSLYINNYADGVEGNIDDLRSNPIDTRGAKAVMVSFDLAHKNYPDPDFTDTLSVLASADCGTTWQTVYKKGGSQLATADTSSFDYLSPAPGDWRREAIILDGALATSSQLVIAIRNTSMFGNNIFIDSLTIGIPPARDIRLLSIDSPAVLVCTPTATPVVTVKNESGDQITSFKVGYKIDGNAAVVQSFNQAIRPNETASVRLNPISIPAGNHLLTLFTADPVSLLGAGDLNPLNDTLTKVLALPGSMQAPLVEAFQTSGFAPTGWAVTNADNSLTWNRSTLGKDNAGSAFVNHYNYNGGGQTDYLFLPQVRWSQADSVKLRFDVAAAPFRLTGPTDTLEVVVTTDCGQTFTTVYKRWGTNLRTTVGRTVEFFPSSPLQWRTDEADLTAWAEKGSVLAAFKVTNNGENNIFLDNVALTSRLLPAQLKEQGYLVLPTVFTQAFTVWHQQDPKTLRAVTVSNSLGQVVWRQQFNANADRSFSVDLHNSPAGIYFVRLSYTDGKGDATVKVVKQ